jgi:DNA polymerase I-like protein with 3'-5' exonuclease and polymerase domains
MKPVGIDFETFAIEPRPQYPPEPVSVGIKEPGKKAEFWAWGHPTKNNCTRAEAKRRLKDVWKKPMLFHNAKFDLDVAETHLGLKFPPWHNIFDTMVEAFLYNPNMPALSLKPLADELLGKPPAERDKLKEWIVANVKGATEKNWGAFIAYAPGNLVRPYCNGDVARTIKLHDFFMKNKPQGRWEEAYERERRLFQIILGMEREGVPIDVQHLESEVQRGKEAMEKADNWIFKKLGTRDVNINSGQQLADALEEADIVDEWIMTDPSKRYPEGQRSTSIENLRLVVKEKHTLLADVLEYRSLLKNQINTFADPWLEMAREGGKIYCQWNQVRQPHERKRGGSKGARTGRLSSSPNFQNIPLMVQPTERVRGGGKNPPPGARSNLRALLIPFSKDTGVVNGRMTTDCDFIDLRGHVVAPRGYLLFDLDYSQQELRILAYFCGGNLLEAYIRDPDLDLHQLAREGINMQLGTNYERKPIKNTGFGIIYGMGLDHLAEDIDMWVETIDECGNPYMVPDRDTAGLLRKTYKEIFPGLGEHERQLRRDKYCITWGGRYNPVEEPKFIHGNYRSFEYKLLNTEIQGSAADCTKEAMIKYDENKDKHEGQLLISVHDELLGIAKTRAAPKAMRALRKAMESVDFGDLKMKAEGRRGKSWRECH